MEAILSQEEIELNLLKSDKRKEEAIYQLEKKRSFSWRFTIFSDEDASLVSHLIHYMLGLYGLNFLSNVVMVLAREMIGNAVKANLKRAFFLSLKKDINHEKDYKYGMEIFKQEGLGQLDLYRNAMEELGLKVEIVIELLPEGSSIKVINNTKVLKQEMIHIHESLQKGKELDSLENIMIDMIQSSKEGGGIGIVMSSMILKQSGIPCKHFSISSKNDTTSSCVFLPSTVRRHEDSESVYRSLIREVEELPSFPEPVEKLLNLITDPEVQMTKIVYEIEKDPFLTSSVLKLINSASFITAERVETIGKAVPIMGIQNIKQMVMLNSSCQILKKKYRVFENFWKHASQCAFYAYFAAKLVNQKKLAETAYICALLHDMGKIILHTFESKDWARLNINLLSKSSPVHFEESFLGISHAELGAQMAEKWCFPENIVSSIRYHHRPMYAEEENRLLASIVHFADSCMEQEEGQKHVYFDIGMKNILGIYNSSNIYQLHRQVKESYKMLDRTENSIAAA